MADIHAQIIQDILKAAPVDDAALFAAVRQSTSGLKMAPPPKSSLIKAYHKLVKSGNIKPNKKIAQLLTKRAVRTMSGVTVISVLTKPYPCPGKCIFCPTEVNMPKSYLSNEPAAMRAVVNQFDPYKQTIMRLKALTANGHATDKIEFIVLGGTWSFYKHDYQDWFIKRCFDALNGRASKTLQAAQKLNETAKHRCIGLSLETRPDHITPAEVARLRRLGCTKVEMGIQHTDNKILELNRRGHTVERSIAAIKLLKDSGFKLNLHFMPNLYGSTPAKDLAMFQQAYTDGNFMPDMIKIYPCVVNEFAELYKLYQAGKFRAYSDKQLADLIVDIKKITPTWTRIARLIRDIPEESIIAGNKITNLRQLISERLVKEGFNCRCIRCREAGHQATAVDSKQELRTVEYRASGGTEYFISIESPDQEVLYAFLRLRINDHPSDNFLEELKGCSLVRELHTYGLSIELGAKGKVQHTGLGQRLLGEAERLTRRHGLGKIAVIAGIGVRSYYKKFGYILDGTYMVKRIN